MESFALARGHAYGTLPAASADGVYLLPSAYVNAATHDVALQLSKAGTRLAALLNRALGAGRDPGR